MASSVESAAHKGGHKVEEPCGAYLRAGSSTLSTRRSSRNFSTGKGYQTHSPLRRLGTISARRRVRDALNHAAFRADRSYSNDDVRPRRDSDVRRRSERVLCFWSAGSGDSRRRCSRRPIPVVVHGYDYPVPDGRGFLGGFGFLAGRGFSPGFHRKGFAISPRTLQSLEAARFVQRHAPRADRHGWIRARPLRGSARHAVALRWLQTRLGRTKLHPTKSGFSAVANKIGKRNLALDDRQRFGGRCPSCTVSRMLSRRRNVRRRPLGAPVHPDRVFARLRERATEPSAPIVQQTQTLRWGMSVACGMCCAVPEPHGRNARQPADRAVA